MLSNSEGHAFTASDVWQVIWHGLSLDLSTSLYFLILPFLTTIISLWWDNRKVQTFLRIYYVFIATMLTLADEGVIAIPDGDEVRVGSIMVDGMVVSSGRHTYATAPAALKAHLAETTGTIIIGRVGTLFLVQ